MVINKKHRICCAAAVALLLQLLPQTVPADAAALPAARDSWTFEDGSALSSEGLHTAAVLEKVRIEDSDSEVFGKALHFSTASGEYMEIPDYINTGEGSHTFALWYNYETCATDGAAESAVMLQHTGNGRTLLSLRSSGQYHTYINGVDKLSAAPVAKGVWQHVAISFNQDSGKGKFYINGELDSTFDLGGSAVNELLTLRLGAHKNADNTAPHQMRGWVDEFKVYDMQLSDEQVRLVYEEKGSQLESEPQIFTLNVSDTVTRTIEPDVMFGINHRYAQNGYGSFDEEAMEVKEDFKVLYEKAGFGSIRYPGGTISNLFNWKTAIGDKETRKKQIHGFYNNAGQSGIAPNFGLAEIGSFAEEMDSEIVYVYSLARGSVQDAQDLVEYLNAQVGTNPNGGIDWAAVRAQNGHSAPYNIRFIEIGNEMNQAFGQNADGTTSQGYWLDYRQSGQSAAQAYVSGSTIQVSEKYLVDEEDWNKTASQSDGSAHLRRYFRYANENPRMEADGQIVMDPDFEALSTENLHIYVGNDTDKTEWTRVDSLEASGPNDLHYVLNAAQGYVQFGDGVHGAIPAYGSNIYGTYSVKRDGFAAISRAMQQTQQIINETEGANLTLQRFASFHSADFISAAAQANAVDSYDGMAIHPYSSTIQSAEGSAFYQEAMLKAQNWALSQVTSMVNTMPAGKVPVISEYGIYNNTQSQVRSQTHPLYLAKVIMEYIEQGSPYIQKHCLVDYYSSGADSLGPTQQAVIQAVWQSDGSYRFFSTPSAGLFEMLNTGFGSQIVQSHLSQNHTLANGVHCLEVMTSKDPQDNYTILLENLDESESHILQLHLPAISGSRNLSVQRLASESILSENTLDEPDNVQPVFDETVPFENDTRITLAPHSIAIVRVYAEQDKSSLQSLCDQIESQTQTSDTAWTLVNTRLKQARKQLANPFASAARIEKAQTRLAQAAAALPAQPDWTLYDALRTEIETQLSEQTRLPEQWATQWAAYAQAKEEQKHQEDIDALVSGMHALWLQARKAPYASALPQ